MGMADRNKEVLFVWNTNSGDFIDLLVYFLRDRLFFCLNYCILFTNLQSAYSEYLPISHTEEISFPAPPPSFPKDSEDNISQD